jgi:predicted RNA methylase
MAFTTSNVTAGPVVGVIGTTGALAQASTASTVVVTGSDVDMRAYKTLSYTISVVTFAVSWSVFGANVSDYSDEVAVLSATSVAAAASSSYTVTNAPYAYYRIKIIDTVGGSHGTATINGLGKFV